MLELLAAMKRDRSISPLSATSAASPIGGAAVAPFLYGGSLENKSRAVSCLAIAAWYEAGDDPAGERAVIQVVLNRVRHPAFPSSVCAVVFQGKELITGCQFSFTCDGSLSRRTPSDSAWLRAVNLAREALNGSVDANVSQATHFHANYVTPGWSKQLERVSQVGPHIFYKWAGARGRIAANLHSGSTEIIPLTSREPMPVARPAAFSSEPVRIEPSPEVFLEGASASVAIASATAAANGLVAGRGQMRFELVDLSGPNGRWAVSAMRQCPKDQPCRVLGYGDRAAIERNSARSELSLDRPLFLFKRDTSGTQLALWDCDRAERSNPGQCLPPNGPELASLLQAS